MLMREILLESGRTLYHGTLRKNLPTILAHGLWPSLGDFTRDAYAESENAGIELDQLVFAADKEGLNSCVSAIIGALRLDGIEDTVDNFFRFGAIVVIREGGDRMEHRDLDYPDEYEEHPETVEPGDYYSHYTVHVDYALTGWRLRSFLRRHGVVVDRFGDDLDRSTADAMLIRYKAPQFRGSRQDLVAKVRAMSPKQVRNALHRHEMAQYA